MDFILFSSAARGWMDHDLESSCKREFMGNRSYVGFLAMISFWGLMDHFTWPTSPSFTWPTRSILPDLPHLPLCYLICPRTGCPVSSTYPCCPTSPTSPSVHCTLYRRVPLPHHSDRSFSLERVQIVKVLPLLSLRRSVFLQSSLAARFLHLRDDHEVI